MLKKALTFLLFFTLLLTGCANSRFQKTYTLFQQSFMRATDFLANSAHETDIDRLRAADTQILEGELQKMADYLEVMKKAAKHSPETRDVEIATENYENVRFFIEARKRIDNLTNDDERELHYAINAVEVHRDFYSGEPEMPSETPDLRAVDFLVRCM